MKTYTPEEIWKMQPPLDIKKELPRWRNIVRCEPVPIIPELGVRLTTKTDLVVEYREVEPEQIEHKE